MNRVDSGSPAAIGQSTKPCG